MLVSATMDRVSGRRVLPWLGLFSILVIYVVSILRIHPTNLFGLTQDDTMYFSSAQALARGNGYILPSVPGTPPSRYPILLPWLLSWVWKCNASFPHNLAGAVGIIVAFGCVYVLAVFVFLRSLMGLGNGESLLLTAFCALHPEVLFFSSCVLSDIPFAALALAAMVVANKAMRRDGGAVGSAVAGILAGLSMLMRVLGGPIAVGILVAAVWRRAWRRAAIFAFCAVPFLVWLFWHTTLSAPATPPASISSFGSGWQQTWLAYTNYIAFRKLSVVNAQIARSILGSQVLYLLTDVPGYFLWPLFKGNAGLALASFVLVLWGILAGMIRQAKHSGWQTIHFGLLFYIGVILSWSYPHVQRFLIPFLPLFAACLWLEGKQVAGRLMAALRGPRPVVEKVLASTFAALMAALILGMTWNFVGEDRAQTRKLSQDRAALLAEKREAYEWLRHNSPDDARVIATEDVCVYLYARRQAIEHIEFSPAGLYDPALFAKDLNHMTDVAKAIGAAYWLASSDDTERQWIATRPLLAARLDQIESVLPEMFRSREGHVRIYGLGCVQHPEDPSCESAEPILFPSESRSASH